MRVYTHPACTRHDPGPGHAERPLRLVAVTEALRESFAALDWHEAPSASRGQLLRAHDDALLALVLDTVVDGPMQLDPDTVLAPGSAEAALRAAGAGVAAVDAVLKGEETRVFCAVRPPGHHATGSAAMGFCLFNNIAVAAAHACDKHGLARVAVIDFDVHHGNGTQAIFDTDPRVLYVSSHQMPLYPDTGYADERGVGNVINAPLPPGAGSATFRQVWRERLLPAIDSFRPQLLLISAGFDAHRRDPLAQLELDGDDYRWITAELVAIADKHARGRVISMLEGGYDLAALRECAVAHVGAMLGASAPA
ncbi:MULTISPECIES: histone deacetylase family protein [unclassified Lysobacter]|uniref:histone deacetylase family protein n=1 Tax=unclassified Lysobacter TaxID=2635362 RepID=UPI000701EBE6|nr:MULTISPECIES: histone deacetylase family protein [unclassified Lysobacter]KQZ66634.1 acetoin utilization protein [Lysobacter sp. Root559]KRA71987.1 acetoin utilization protein [Lysobacter sp. Root667]KRC32786.1 acetoin utilization protein [Lysobacter sp. Root76]KRD67871.1 acetoin utilization protein [Lysobacter sp. Root96]